MNLQLTDEEAVIVHRACKAMMLHLAENLGNPIPEDARPTVKTIDDLKQKIEGQLQANGIDPQMNIPGRESNNKTETTAYKKVL